jgi:hypothetical protein
MNSKITRIALTIVTLISASSPVLAREHSGSGAAGGPAVSHSNRRGASVQNGDNTAPDTVYSALKNYSEHFGSKAVGPPSLMAPTGQYTRR